MSDYGTIIAGNKPEYDVFHDNTRQSIPRIYYKAEASNGRVGLRGSWRDVYTHAVIQVDNEQRYDNELISYVTYHSSLQLAKRRLTSLTNYYANNPNSENFVFEIVELQKITAKEFRKYKALQKKGYTKFFAQELQRERQRVIDHTGITPDVESEGN